MHNSQFWCDHFLWIVIQDGGGSIWFDFKGPQLSQWRSQPKADLYILHRPRSTPRRSEYIRIVPFSNNTVRSIVGIQTAMLDKMRIIAQQAIDFNHAHLYSY